jgi:hypothetical protein
MWVGESGVAGEDGDRVDLVESRIVDLTQRRGQACGGGYSIAILIRVGCRSVEVL